MQKCKNILLKISVMNVLCCLSLGVIEPLQVKAEGSFTETAWIPNESLSAYTFFMDSMKASEAAEGNTLQVTSDINATIQEISYTSGNGSISTTTNGSNTISDIVMNIVNDLPTISQNTGNLLDIKFETGSEYPAINEIGCTFSGYTDYQPITDDYEYDNLTVDCNIQGLSGDVSIYDAAAWREALSWHVDLYTAGTDPVTGEETEDAITITAVESTTGNEFLSLTTNSNATLSGTIVTSATGSWNYQYPWLEFNDNLPADGLRFSWSKPYLYLPAHTTYYLSFIWKNPNPSTLVNMKELEVPDSSGKAGIYLVQSGHTVRYLTPVYSEVVYNLNGAHVMLKSTYAITNNGSSNMSLNLYINNDASFMADSSSGKVTSPRSLQFIPLYMGYGNDISDEFRRYIGLSDRLLELLENGTAASNESGSNLDNSSGSFSDASNDLIDLEDSAINDMQSDLTALDTGGIISNLSSFNNAINWVKVQFEAMTVNYPIGIFISVSLLLALAAVLVGRL